MKEAELERFVREEYRTAVDSFTAMQEQLSLALARFKAKFSEHLVIRPDSELLDERTDASGVPASEIVAFYTMLDMMAEAQPVGSTDVFLARRINPMRVSG